ncbi:hypothetical protein QTL97_13910 [Sporosarcina thermotolerans]|uniref:Aspartyl/asparaginyl-tRNA synthetase n=1 Tax=Sporosarcina thermotolerans TaxID=633404 RepID=A0AAW9A8S2_9BACL|nr:hypothetical protein [Sporosarcina thermotolerans]MDW0118036.1 hypothetical protein [Sporosarcina thermotolerans]WHT49097.1 hypothetical protein QNH10_05395 [Sporosarcina thermotolerans]
MKHTKVFVIGIILFALATLIFVIKGQLEYAVLMMMALFTLTNASRSKAFKEQGHERESKLMRYLSIFFAIGFVIVFFLIFF